MTVNIQSLDWDTGHFDVRHADFGGKAADLDDNTVAIIDHNVDTSTSDLAVGTPETNTWFHSSDPQDWPELDRWFGREEWQEFVQNHQDNCREELLSDETAEAEVEHGSSLTDEQKIQIRHMVLVEGDSFDRAFEQATSVTAELTIASESHHGDFVRFRTAEGTYLEKDTSGGVEEGVYVAPSEDKAPYGEAAEQWLRGVPGIWVLESWD